MPNTLAHIGAQVLPWKVIDRKTDVKWLATGCIIPDVPWILQRIATLFFPTIAPLDLRIYFMIQATLFFCLLLGLAISLVIRRSGTVFLICASGSLLHLLLDASQTKWANGVHLLAPLSWNLTQFELFWPENLLTLILTTAGFISLLFFGWRDRFQIIELRVATHRLVGSAFLLSLYLLLPLTLFQGPIQADNHYVGTLADVQGRVGQPVGFDRCFYDHQDKTIRVFTREHFQVTGLLPETSGIVSLNGTFVNGQTIAIESLHLHYRIRDLYSIVGLALVLSLWLIAIGKGRIHLTR